MKRRPFIRPLLASIICAGFAMPALAANAYPAKPIKVIVPYAAGGVVDVQTRAVTESMAQFLKQPIIVEPRPGASGSIAAEAVARAEPDGYTLVVSASFLFTQPLLETNLRWSPRQFTPVGRFALSPSYFVVPNNSPAKTMKEFVDYAKKASPPLQYANGGDGAPQTMATELFRVAAGIKLEPVMYKGAPPQCLISSMAWWRLAFCPRPWVYRRSRVATCACWPTPAIGARPNCRMCRPLAKPASLRQRSIPGMACMRPWARRPKSSRN